MEKEEIKQIREISKKFVKIADTSWSGYERVVVQSGIYFQLRKIANELEKLNKKGAKK